MTSKGNNKKAEIQANVEAAKVDVRSQIEAVLVDIRKRVETILVEKEKEISADASTKIRNAINVDASKNVDITVTPPPAEEGESE